MPLPVPFSIRRKHRAFRSWAAALSLLLLPGTQAATHNFDVVVYGGTSAGVVVAIQARKMGKTVALIEPTARVGGMTTNGLSATDTGKTAVIQGLSREFYLRVGQKYGSSAPEWNFEPKVALQVFTEWLQQWGVAVFEQQRLWLAPDGVTMAGPRVTAIRMESGEVFTGRMFIDASYEGDLMAWAGVSYTVGRESNSTYGETYNGYQDTDNAQNFKASIKTDPYVVPGNPASGLLPGIEPQPPGSICAGDSRLQAYNFRLTVTKDANRRPWTAPAGYSASQYELLRRYIAAEGIGSVTQILSINAIQGGKSDINNKGAVSTDFIGQNYAYPDADYATRQAIIDAHRRYQQGLLYFLATDPSVPAIMRGQMNSMGLPMDEFTNTAGWPEQLYIREARRMIGPLVMTDRHLLGLATVSDSVGMGSYTMDSHNASRYVTSGGAARNEGNVQVGLGPYRISYRAITPVRAEATNLLVTCALSASHIAYGSIRMEPVFMILGQSAATAACLAMDAGTAVQDVPYATLRARLLSDGQEIGDSSPASDIVVDNTDAAPLVQFTGDWLASTSVAGYYGSNYQHDNNTGKGQKSVRYTPSLPVTGWYDVHARWTANPNRATNVPISIVHADGTANLTVDQTLDGGAWVLLGRFWFPAGSAGSLTIGTAGTNGYVIADSVRFSSVTPGTPELTGAVSRKVHGTAGAFDLSLPLTGTAGVEPRSPGAEGRHVLVFTFNKPVVSGAVSLLSGQAAFSAPPAFSGTTLTVQLTGATDRQKITLGLANITAQDGTGSTSATVSFRTLEGDANRDGVVNAADAASIKSSSGTTTSAAIATRDINADGVIDAADVARAKSTSGASVPN